MCYAFIGLAYSDFYLDTRYMYINNKIHHNEFPLHCFFIHVPMEAEFALHTIKNRISSAYSFAEFIDTIHECAFP